MTNDLREKVAEAIAKADPRYEDTGRLPWHTWMADAALAAIQADYEARILAALDDGKSHTDAALED